MKLWELLRKGQLLLIIACGTYPVVMLVLDRLAPGLMGAGWLFSAGYVVLAMAGIQVRGKWRLAAGGALAAGFVLVSVLLSPRESLVGAVAAAVLCSGLMIWSLKMGGWSARQEIPVLWIAAGVVLQLVGQIFVHVDRVAGAQGLARYTPQMLVSLFGFALLTMLSMNRNGLNAASGKRQNVPGVMRQKNALLTGVLFTLALLTALLPSVLGPVAQALGRALLQLVEWIAALFAKLPQNTVEDVTQAVGEAGHGGQGAGQALVLSPLAEKIALFGGMIITLLMLLFLAVHIFRYLQSGFRKLINGLSRFTDSVAEDYIDEVTDTRQELTQERLQRRRRASRQSFRDQRNLTPEQRVRLRYQRLLHRHPEWAPGTTARETLPESLAAVYEQARYSSRGITPGDADAFTEGSKGL